MGTLTTDVAKAIQEVRAGRLDYRMGRDGMYKATIGKVSHAGPTVLHLPIPRHGRRTS